jgi:HEAT repeat protein
MKTPHTGKNRLLRIALVALLAVCAVLPLAAQAAPPERQTPPEQDSPPAQSPAPAKTEELVRSLAEERREIIKYGLETEIIDLLAALKNEKNSDFVDEFAGVLASRPGVKTAQEIFSYLGAMGSGKGVPSAEKYLEDYENQPREIIIAVLRYLAEEEDHSFPEKIYPLLASANPQLAAAAVRYLGKKRPEGASEKLLELFSKEETSQALRGEVILALGEMKAQDAVAFLTSLLEDEDEDMTLRRYACDSLGRIGDEKALPAIRAALNSSDNFLRSYAVSSLGYFSGEENAGVLVEALRDSFPRVRELAAERLGDMEYENAVDILIYRARKDPEKRVRQAAFRSLSKIGTSEAVSFLQEFLEGERNPGDLRSLAAEELTDTHPAAMAQSAARVMAKEWAKDRSPILDVICRLLSQKEYSGFDDLYKRMLGHTNFIIQIYGVRGVQKNHVTGLKTELEALSAEGRHPQLRKNALSALEGL